MLIFGGILIGVAALWILYKVYVSYSSGGGTAFEVPVYDAAIYPPVMSTGGLFLVQQNLDATWPVWAYLLSTELSEP